MFWLGKAIMFHVRETYWVKHNHHANICINIIIFDTIYSYNYQLTRLQKYKFI